MRIAILGTRGLPNTYGGFETLAEYLVKYLAKELHITVFCSSKDMTSRIREYNGAKLEYVPITSHGVFGILYDSVSLVRAIAKYDKILLLGFGGGYAIPFLKKYKSKIIVNIGGLDWTRDKWSPLAKKVIKLSEKLLINNCSQIISDNVRIQQYLLNEYGKESTLITYGGDQATKQRFYNGIVKSYPFLKSNYAFIVTRIQQDNNVQMLLDSFENQAQMPLVMVGNWNNSEYGREIKNKYQKKNNLILLDAIYDRRKLDTLRSNCTVYVHGHSAGGTNPSLVEAMYLGLPILAYASGYNEYTTDHEAIYFKNSKELKNLVDNYQTLGLEAIGKRMKAIAEKEYRWSIISEKYKEVFLR